MSEGLSCPVQYGCWSVYSKNINSKLVMSHDIVRADGEMSDTENPDSSVLRRMHVTGLPRSEQDNIPCVFPVFFAFSLCFFIDKIIKY